MYRLCSLWSLRNDFDFFFAFKEVVNDLVKVDFLYKKKPLQNPQTMLDTGAIKDNNC